MKTLENVIPHLLIFAVLFALIWIIVRMRRDGQNNHYDEMQLSIRLKGYKIGFFVTLTGLFILIFTMECSNVFESKVSASFALGLVGFAGIVTFAVYCILKDAFFSIGQNRKSYMILCLIVVLSSGIGMIGSVREWMASEDKTLTFVNSANLLCGVSFLIILIALIAKDVHDRKEEAAE